ncbi:hypothetical protein [Bartonella phoceensis]|nr:hypothetical protein [Bartonella phoceensis]
MSQLYRIGDYPRSKFLLVSFGEVCGALGFWVQEHAFKEFITDTACL